MNQLAPRIRNDGNIQRADLSPEIGLVQSAVHASFPQKTCKTKADLFTRYGQRLDLFGQRMQEANNLFALIARNAGFDEPPAMQLHVQNIAGAELAVRPFDEIDRLMEADHLQNARQFAEGMVDVFEEMVDRRIVGLIDWHAEDVARYRYSRRTLTEKEEVRQGNVFQVRTRITETHFHDIIDAKVHDFPARSVPKPRRVQTLVSGLPTWIQPSIKVVTGTQIRDVPVRQEEQRETWKRSLLPSRTQQIPAPRTLQLPSSRQTTDAAFTVIQGAGLVALGVVGVAAIAAAAVTVAPFALVYVLVKYDPALILGRYVIAGWQDGER